MIKFLLSRTAGASVAVFLMVWSFSGCGAVKNVDRMEGDLEAMRPSIEEIPALADSLAAIASSLDEMTTTLGAVHTDLANLSRMADGVANMDKQLELVSRDLDSLDIHCD